MLDGFLLGKQIFDLRLLWSGKPQGEEVSVNGKIELKSSSIGIDLTGKFVYILRTEFQI